MMRRLEQFQIELIAALDRDGVFAERGYRSAAHAVGDLLGWDIAQARRRLKIAAEITERTTLDGQPLPARLPATAAAFTTGHISLGHAEVIADALHTPAAGRLDAQVWAGAEAELAEQAAHYRPSELAVFATDLITALDQDGPEPDDEPGQVNELRFSVRTGKLVGQLDGITRELVATALDALLAPGGEEDPRSTPQRRADALGEVCRRALDTGSLPERSGERPHVSVVIRLEDLERRARTALLDFGSHLHPADLRMLACDARVVPVVLGGAGQPLDVGRAQRTVPDGIRRAVLARDGGCAFPGCDRPPSWCDIHHIQHWQHLGVTAVHNCIALCRMHHRLLHKDSGWTVRIRNGLPEFTPPTWIDPDQIPRRKPPPVRT